MAKGAKGFYKQGILAGVVAEVQRVIRVSSTARPRDQTRRMAPRTSASVSADKDKIQTTSQTLTHRLMTVSFT